jgi:hypothetical protein
LLVKIAPAGDSGEVDEPPQLTVKERAARGKAVRKEVPLESHAEVRLGADAADGEQDCYVRQLRDWKMSADIESLTPDAMVLYARLCGWTLARAHARSGDRFALAAYLGKPDRFDRAVADFADTYAAQNIQDHETFAKAVADDRVEARTGV